MLIWIYQGLDPKSELSRIFRGVSPEVEVTWGEWAIAMHGRYESPVLLILFTHICYVHSMIFLYFSWQLVMVACLH
jgi:hypothetical protein